MAVLYSNNATTTITGALTTSSTSISLATGAGSLFPALTSPDVFYGTLVSGSVNEIVQVTARSGDTLTVVRAQDGTTAQAWSAGATFELRITKAMMDGKQNANAVSPTVTAGTNAQGQGALTSEVNVISTASSNPSGVTLPTATLGRRIIVVNKGANPVNVYPATGATIDGLAANASLQVPVSGYVELVASSTTQWYSSKNNQLTETAGLATGLLKNTTATGALSVAVAGTDFQAPITATGLLKGAGAGSVSGATAGTDYQAAITATGLLKGAGSGSVSAATAGTDYTTPTGTETLSNKRVTPRVGSTSSGSTITPTGDSGDQYEITALAAAATIAAPTGTPTDGQKLILRIKDSGTAQTLTWTTTSGAYRAVGVTLPATTTASKVTYVGCVYNSQDTFWDVIAVATQA